MAEPPGASGRSWRRRLKAFLAHHIRQVPCLHAVLQPLVSKLRCCKSQSYQTLGQDEADDGAEVYDDRQKLNRIFGQAMIKAGILAMIGVTALLLWRNSNWQPNLQTTTPPSDDAWDNWDTFGGSPDAADQFQHDAPVVLYFGAVEVLLCGACAHTASAMYRRRRHALKHPADVPEEERRYYGKARLEKRAGFEDTQHHGFSFRPSTDGLECLIVEGVRRGSLLDRWNVTSGQPSSEELVEEAFGGDPSPQDRDGEGAEIDGNSQVPSSSNQTSEAPQTLTREALATAQRKMQNQVHPYSIVVAVNEVTADVGMMQAQLLKPKVTLWLRSDLSHASQFDDSLFVDDVTRGPGWEAEAAGVARHGDTPSSGSAEASASGSAAAPPEDGNGSAPSQPGPTFFGRAGDDWGATPDLEGAPTPDATLRGPRCVCLGLEDEEPQILTRWTVCAIIFGWVTMLPVLFMRPHEERPRQQLFRQYLLKPCLFILPVAILLWVLDCLQMLIQFKIIHPFWYFSISHMLLPGVLVWYLFQMQAADERLVVEQRRSRAEEAGAGPPLCIEDPSPTFLKELITINPVALIWLGAVASVPIIACCVLTQMQTKRAKLAQSFVNMIYGPLVFAQVMFVSLLWQMRFEDLPKFYIAVFGVLLSVPCFLVWCVCLMCAARYGRKDLALVESQRLERGRATKALQQQGAGGAADRIPDIDVVDCTEARFREWELIYTA